MFHVYAFGKKSKQILIMTPQQAQTMNDFTKCFFRSQEAFLNENGYRWDPTVDAGLTFLVPKDDPQLLDRYNKLVNNLNRQHAIRNKLFDIFKIDVREETTEDYLVRKF